MSGVTGDFAKLDMLVQRLGELKTPRLRKALVRNIAEEYVNFMKECFDQGHGPYDEVWAPLKFRTSDGGAAQKPLQDTGIMKDAIAPIDLNENGFRVHVTAEYASVHQGVNGPFTVIEAKNKKCLVFRGVTYKQTVSAKTGRKSTRRKYGGWIFVKRVIVPARPFAPLKGIPWELDESVKEAADEFMHKHFQD